jgi:hypothetical protein
MSDDPRCLLRSIQEDLREKMVFVFGFCEALRQNKEKENKGAAK